MPTQYRLQITKELGQAHWSNEYYLSEETVEDAQDVANEILTFERRIHQGQVNFSYIRISTTLVGDRYFRHIGINLPGLFVTEEYMPLYCTARMDMPTANSDPCRKYYRLPIGEARQANGVFNADYLAILATAISETLVTPDVLSHIYTPVGNVVISASFNRIVQMRQQHRHRRKKVVTPPVTP